MKTSILSIMPAYVLTEKCALGAGNPDTKYFLVSLSICVRTAN